MKNTIETQLRNLGFTSLPNGKEFYTTIEGRKLVVAKAGDGFGMHLAKNSRVNDRANWTPNHRPELLPSFIAKSMKWKTIKGINAHAKTLYLIKEEAYRTTQIPLEYLEKMFTLYKNAIEVDAQLDPEVMVPLRNKFISESLMQKVNESGLTVEQLLEKALA